MDESKRFIIDTIYNAQGLKSYANDLNMVRELSKKFSTTLSKDAVLLEQQTTESFSEKGKKIVATTATVLDQGKKMQISFKATEKGITGLSQKFIEHGATVVSSVKPLKAYEQGLSNVTSINKNFGRELGTAFTRATTVVEKLGTTVTQKKMKIDGKDVVVPVQKMSTVVATADGKLQQLTKTVTTMPDKTTRVKRGIKDVTKSFHSLRTTTKATEKSVSGLSQKFVAQSTTIINSVKPFKKYEQELTSLSSLNKNFAKQYGESFKKASVVVEKMAPALSQKKMTIGGKEFLVPIQKLSTVVGTADGKLKQLTQTITTMPNGTTRVKRSIKDVTKSFHGLRGASDKLQKSGGKVNGVMNSMGGQLKKLLRRAVLVIPVWLLLRSAMMSTLRVIKESIKFMVEWEYQLAQIRLVGDATEAQINNLSNSLLRLSTSLGISNMLLGEGCFDPKTEILTDSGWKYFKDLDYQDKILSMNPKNRDSQYKPIKNIIAYDYDGEMLAYDSILNFKVTPNHRFLYTDQHQRKFQKDEIQNISYDKWYIPVSSNWQGEDIKKSWEFYEKTSKRKLSCDTSTFMQFLGWYISEGCTIKDKKRPDTYRFNIGQTKKENLLEISNVLKRMGFSGKWKKAQNGFLHANKALCKYLLENCYVPGMKKSCFAKRIPIDLKHYSVSSLNLLLDALIKGDGHRYKNRKLKAYFTSSKQLADDVQEIALKCGYSVNITKSKKRTMYNVWISSSKNRRIYNKEIKKEYYKGKVYCVEVEPYNTICVRREGSAYWTLNSKLFIQQGRSIEEIVPLMESTAKLSLLTGRTIVQSVEDITAVLKAYKLEAKDASSVVDMITATMLGHAITAADLASAYKATASTAEALGVSLSSLTGFVTAIKVVTRDTGTKVGTALRTMFSRISTSSAESLQKLTKVPFYLDEMGKTTSQVTPKMRNMSTIISEMAMVFGTLENAQQSQIAKLIGGIRRQNQVFALFNNFTEAVEAQTDALLGLGKADEAIATLTDTTKLRVEQLKGAWGEWVDVVGDTQIFKTSLDFMKTQILGAIAILDPARAFAVAFGEEIRSQGNKFNQEGKFVEGVKEIQKELLEMEEIASRTTSTVQLEQLAQRTKVYAKALHEAFAEHDIEVPINPKMEDWGKLSKIIKETMPELFELDVEAKVKADTLGLQNQLLDLSKTIRHTFDEKEAQKMNKDVRNLHLTFKVLNKAVKDIQFTNARKSLEKLAKGSTLTKNEFKTLEKAGKRIFEGEELEGFINLLQKVDFISKDMLDVDQRRIDKVKELTTIAKQFKEQQILEATIKRDLIKLDRTAIELNLDRLEIVNRRIKILENINNVTSPAQDNELESLRTERHKLGVLKDRNKLQTQNAILINKLKVQGASKLKILIQELAFLNQINDHEDKRLEKQKEIAIERQNLEVTVLNTALQGQLGILKAQGASELQIIKTRIEMEKKLGIEKKGLAYLKEQFEIQQAITKETQRTRQERQADLKAAIIKKRKEEFEADPFRQSEFKGQERRMEKVAKEAGLTQKEIDEILRPTEGLEADLPKSMQDLIIENGVLSDSMFTLQGAIEELTNTMIGKPSEGTTDLLGLPTQEPLGEKRYTQTEERRRYEDVMARYPSDPTVEQVTARYRAEQKALVTQGAKQAPKFSVSFGDTVINVAGGASEEVLEQIDKKLNQHRTEMANATAKAIKDPNAVEGKAVREVYYSE